MEFEHLKVEYLDRHLHQNYLHIPYIGFYVGALQWADFRNLLLLDYKIVDYLK